MEDLTLNEKKDPQEKEMKCFYFF